MDSSILASLGTYPFVFHKDPAQHAVASTVMVHVRTSMFFTLGNVFAFVYELT